MPAALDTPRTAPDAEVAQTLDGTTDRAKEQTEIGTALQGHPEILTIGHEKCRDEDTGLPIGF